MRGSILFGIFSSLLFGCGGGGGASNESPSPEPTEPEPPTEILYTKVIDGYVSGANIFIDHNWNLIQDDGEPSAYEDADNQRYYFYEEDFSTIDNCILLISLPKISGNFDLQILI